VAEKLYETVVKFDMYRNLQWHCAVLPAIAQPLLLLSLLLPSKYTNRNTCIWHAFIVPNQNLHL